MNWHSGEIEGLVRQALAEDVGAGDATTAAIVPRGTPAKAVILARQTLVCAGLPLADSVFRALDRAHAYTSLKMPAPRAASAYDAAGLDPEVVGPGPLSVQIEVRNEAELREALEAGADSVLLDNMIPEEAKRCVALARSLRRDCVIEISGGITVENARAYAETGADFLSSWALTHSAPAANLSLFVERVAET